MLAAALGWLEVVQFILKLNANPNHISNSGYNACDYACMYF